MVKDPSRNETQLCKSNEISVQPTICSAIIDGLQTRIANLETAIIKGYSGIQLIGHTAEICEDGKERAKSALSHMGVDIPERKIIINISPADIKKNHNHFDLPMAIALWSLVTEPKLRIKVDRWVFIGELGISGSIKPVKGVISIALCAAQNNFEGIIVPKDNLAELKDLTRFNIPKLSNLNILGFEHCGEVLNWLVAGTCQDNINPMISKPKLIYTPNFDDMVLTKQQKLAAETVAAGRHSLLLRGTPGTGKSMFAARIPALMPNMSPQEHLEALEIKTAFFHDIPCSLLQGIPPFRDPHHQASASAILGNADHPGELSLAHGGILFLDELPEFKRDLLEALREPLQTGEIKVSRAQKKIAWKCRTLFIAACNNCPCGWIGSKKNRCSCSGAVLVKYNNRLSGPILDRIEIHFEMPENTEQTQLLMPQESLSGQTKVMRDRVDHAIRISHERNNFFGIKWNNELTQRQIAQVSGYSQEAFIKLIESWELKRLTTRSLLNWLKVARTLADLRNSNKIDTEDLEFSWQWRHQNQQLPNPIARTHSFINSRKSF